MKIKIHPNTMPLVKALEETKLLKAFVARIKDEGTKGYIRGNSAEVWCKPIDCFSDTHIEFLIEKVISENVRLGDIQLSVRKRFIPDRDEGPIEYSYDFVFYALDDSIDSEREAKETASMIKEVADSVTRNWERHIKR